MLVLGFIYLSLRALCNTPPPPVGVPGNQRYIIEWLICFMNTPSDKIQALAILVHLHTAHNMTCDSRSMLIAWKSIFSFPEDINKHIDVITGWLTLLNSFKIINILMFTLQGVDERDFLC